MSSYWQVLFFSLVGGVFSLVGGALLLSNKKTAQALAKYATPFAAGALLAAAFFDMLPESMHELAVDTAARWVLAGILAFFLLEHFVRWFHHHHEHGAKTTAPLVIVGDTLHNILDGIAIGAAFLIDAPTGIVAAIAVAAHEIPQEIGDFGLLLKFGWKRKDVLIVNALSALASTMGALVTFWIGSEAELPVGALLAITAGMFIYIAASDLIPTIHEETRYKVGHMAAPLLLIGVLVIAITTTIAHEYIDTGHEHETTSEHAEEHEEEEHEDVHGEEENLEEDHHGEEDAWHQE
jgi:zinc and cadmium transporter